MAQYFKDGKGVMHEFPDDATPEEIDIATRSLSAPKAPAEVYDPTEGMSALDKVAAGFGKSIYDTGRGIKQIFGGYTPEEVEEQRRLDAPLMDTGAGVVGNVIGAGAQLAIPGGQASLLAKAPQAVAKVAPYALAGAQAAGFAGLQPVGVGETRLGNAAEGGAWGVGGQAVGAGVGRLAKGGSDKLSPMAHDLYMKAKAAGIDVMPHQLSDARVIKWLASVTKDIPFTGAASANKRQVDQFTRAFSKTIGQNTDEISPSVLDDASSVISKLYDDAYDGVQVTVDGQAGAAYQKLVKSLEPRLTADQKRQFGALAEEVGENINNGRIDGKVYQELRKELKAIQSENPNAYGNAVKELQAIIDSTAKRSLPPERVAMHQRADRLYRNKKVADKALSRADTMDVKTATEGKVNPATLRSATGGKYKPTEEMDTLARIGQMIKDPAPQSGTMPRQLVGGALLAGGGAVAPPGVLGTLALGVGAGRAVNSRLLGRYLAEGAPKEIQGLARLIQGAAPKALPAFALTGAKPLTEEEKKKLKKKP